MSGPDKHAATWTRFATWDDVLQHIATGASNGTIYYHAPMNTRPTLLETHRTGPGTARLGGGRPGAGPRATVRITPWDCPAESDPFDADESHLDRFRYRGETTARRLWDFTRGLMAYNLPTWARDDLVARRKNQHATRYVFRDGSTFIQYRDHGHRAYTSPTGVMMGAYTRNGATPVFCRDSFELCRDGFAADRAAGLIYMAHVRDDGSFHASREAWSAETGRCAYCGAVANP